jgi:hypothetical protein
MIRNLFWYLIPFVLFTFLYILSFSVVPRSLFIIPLLGPVAILLSLSILMMGVLKLIVDRVVPPSFNIKDILIVTIASFFINYNIYGLIPFNASRSNSIIMVGYLLQNEGQPKSESEIESYVKTIYFDKYHAIKRRLDEQIKAGNIAEANGKYYLTSRGKFLTELFANVTDLYRTDCNFAKLLISGGK